MVNDSLGYSFGECMASNANKRQAVRISDNGVQDRFNRDETVIKKLPPNRLRYARSTQQG